MSGFGKIAGASASGGGNHIRDGIYTVLVEEVTLEKKYSGEMFIAECRVMKAEPNGETDDKGNQIVPNKVGSTFSLTCNLTKHDSAAGDAKAFVLAVLGARGYTEEQITEQLMTEVCDKRIQPLRGMAVECRTRRKLNQGKVNPLNKGKVMTIPGWYTIAPQAPEQIKAQRAYLDSNKPGTDTTKPAAAAVQTVAAPVAPVAQPAAIIETPAAGSTLSALLGGS